MLKEKNNQNLRLKNIDEAYFSLYQIWQELVDFRTLDVYQYRVLNSLNALVELDDVISKTIEGLYNTNHNIDSCREETLYILNTDDILEKYERPLLNRLKTHLGIKTDSTSKQKALRYQVNYAIKKLSPIYLNLLFDELKNDIASKDIGLIVKHSNSIISQCITNGWSSKALFDAVRYLEKSEPDYIKWNNFRNYLTCSLNVKHSILIGLFITAKKGERPEQQEQLISTLSGMGITIKTYTELVEEYSEIKDMRTRLKTDKKYIQVFVDSPDIYSATHLAIKQIADKINIASFYNLMGAWDLRSITIIAINNLTRYHREFPAEQLYKTYDYIESSGVIFESTKKIFMDASKKTIQDKLQGAFGYTNISRASLFQEEKYMTLWVALESLARTDMYGDIITNIKEILPAALCLRYVYRIVRNFAEDCDRCSVTFNFSTVTIDLKQSTKRNLVKEVVSVLQNDTFYQELKQKCLVNDFLSYRCDIVRKLVTDVKFATEKIENHYKRVKWQVQRLYRIRNEITHSALQDKTSLIIYIEHLYDYLSIFISEIVTCIEDKHLDSMGEVFCIIKDNYDVFYEFATSKELKDKDLIKNTLLKTGVIDLTYADGYI